MRFCVWKSDTTGEFVKPTFLRWGSHNKLEFSGHSKQFTNSIKSVDTSSSPPQGMFEGSLSSKDNTMRIGMQTVRQLALSATIITVLFTCSILHVRAATATTYYVATTGNDANPGTQTQPFATMTKGISVLRAGDTLYVRGGTYSGYNINDPVPSGTSWATPITIAGYPGETVTVPGLGMASLTLSYYVIFDNFIVDGSGIGTLYDHQHIRFQNLEVKNSSKTGVSTYGANSHDIQFINLKVHDNGSSFFDHGFYIETADVLIQGCDVYQNAGYGIQLYNGYTHSGIDNAVIRNNRVHDNGFNFGGGGVTLGDGNNIQFYNNLVYHNYKGIDVNKNVNNTQVYHNTIYNNSPGAGIEVSTASTGAIVQNNIVYQNGNTIVDAGVGTVISNNLTTDPKFVAPSTANFLLQSASPAIDTGITLSAVSTDYDGTPRPQGARYDVGAYEYRTSSQLPAPQNLRTISIVP